MKQTLQEPLTRGGEYTEPYVSLVTEDNSVHYNKPYLCKLTLYNGTTKKLYDTNGDGILTYAKIGSYRTQMTIAEIGKACTSIGNNAFTGCTRLTSVTIPDSVRSIGSYAFDGCIGLTSVTVNATTPPTLGGTSVFSNTNSCPIYVPSGSVSAYQTATNWSSYASRIEAIPST